jgi:hypothetical protein
MLANPSRVSSTDNGPAQLRFHTTHNRNLTGSSTLGFHPDEHEPQVRAHLFVSIMTTGL